MVCSICRFEVQYNCTFDEGNNAKPKQDLAQENIKTKDMLLHNIESVNSSH